MSISANAYAKLSKDCYNDHQPKDQVIVDGVWDRRFRPLLACAADRPTLEP